jgi:diguanylate cyclase (GGDEF)-like protein
VKDAPRSADAGQVTGVRRPGLDSRTGAAWLAAASLAALAALVLISFSFIHGHASETPAIVGWWLPVTLVSLLLAALLPWDSLPREALLLVPLLLLGRIEVTGRWAPAVGPAYSPMVIVAFLFVGLTQRRYVSPLLLPPSLVAWADALHHAVNDQEVVRAVVVSVVWVLAAEAVAWRMADQARVHGELSAFADKDALTGLGNRRALATRLKQREPQTALVMIDIDHFKVLNDTFGHLEGDRVLADFAHVLAAVLRNGDGAFRYGGEEFLVIAPRTGLAGAQRLLGRVRKAWEVAHPEVTFSAGAAVWLEGETSQDVLGRADAALYRAKSDGRDCWRVSDERAPITDPAAV